MQNSENEFNLNQYFDELESKLSIIWKEIFETSKLIKAIDSGEIDKPFYAIYMIETYHYTQHNATNQALVGTRTDANSVYTKFCYLHAAEEVGHEKMALHDVRSIGLIDVDFDIPKPLVETEILIAYLYWVSLTGNPLQRLGYSYWAENCYKYINPMIVKLQHILSLDSSQLTFFMAHSEIDAEHFVEVKNIIIRTCRTPDDLDAIAQVMENSLRLTSNMLEGVHAEYIKYKQGLSTKYSFLKQLEN